MTLILVVHAVALILHLIQNEFEVEDLILPSLYTSHLKVQQSAQLSKIRARLSQLLCSLHIQKQSQTEKI